MTGTTMTGTTVPIAPADIPERDAIRGCHSCQAHDGTRCRRGAPGPQGWPETAPDDWCLEWAWRTNPRVTWNSAICKVEREQAEDTLPRRDDQSNEEEPPF